MRSSSSIRAAPTGPWKLPGRFVRESLISLAEQHVAFFESMQSRAPLCIANV